MKRFLFFMLGLSIFWACAKTDTPPPTTDPEIPVDTVPVVPPIIKENITFEDETFERVLLDESRGHNPIKIDEDEDGKISKQEAEKVVSINASNSTASVRSTKSKGISSMMELMFFSALSELNCEGNSLITLNLTLNISLEVLNCGNNKIKELNLSKNTALKKVDCAANEIETINVTSNSELEELNCGDNKIKELELPENSSLTKLELADNKIGFIDLSDATSLTVLDCGGNDLKSLDLSNNTSLEKVEISDNKIEVIDVSMLENIEEGALHIGEQKDDSGEVRETSVLMTEEQKETVLSEGSKDNVEKIDVEDAILFTCKNFKVALLEKVDTDDSGEISYNEAKLVKEIDVSNKRCTSMAELKFFIALESLDCSGNELQTLDVSIFPNLGKHSLTCGDQSSDLALTITYRQSRLPILTTSGNDGVVITPSLPSLDGGPDDLIEEDL